MSYDYAPIAATSARLVERFGRDLALRTLTKTGDAWNPDIYESDETVTGIVRPYTSREAASDGIIPGRDQLAIFAGDVTPSTGQRLVDGDRVFEIVSVQTVKPGDTTLVHFVQVRL